MEDNYPGLWQRWYKNQCVSIGWGAYRGRKLREKSKDDPAWETYRKYLMEIKPNDYVVAALPNNRIGRVGQVVGKAVEDDEWDPLVPIARNHPFGEMGRRIIVRWDLSIGPMNPDLVVKLPAELRFTGGELRRTISKIRKYSIEDIMDAVNDPSNWIGLFGEFGYEQALSDYIANYPHHLEENLTAFPDSKIRERVFKDRSRADVMLMDKDNTPVIVECKQNPPSKEDIEQLKKYMRHLSKEMGEKPRGILVHGGSPKLHGLVFKAAAGYRIDIMNYKLDIEFRKSFC